MFSTVHFFYTLTFLATVCCSTLHMYTIYTSVTPGLAQCILSSALEKGYALEMNPFAVYRLGLELVKVPIKLLRVFVMNVANLVAPDWTFKMLKRGIKMIYKDKMDKISYQFESTSDMVLFFSLDLVWVRQK